MAKYLGWRAGIVGALIVIALAVVMGACSCALLWLIWLMPVALAGL